MSGNNNNIDGNNSGLIVGGSVEGGVNYYNNIKPVQRILSRLPASIGIDLIGRKSIEDKLYEDLNISDGTQAKLLLRSIGGIGKTTLAKAIFNRCLSEYYFKHFIWLNADDEQGMLFVAQELKINIDIKQESWENGLSVALANLPRPCLAVIDNLTIDKQDKFSALINCPNWYLLVTSRQKLSIFTEEILDCLSEDDCIALYKLSYGFDDDSEIVRALVRQAGYHTLAIELLGKTAAASEKTAINLLKDLKSKGFDLSNIYKETIEARYGQQDKDIEKRLYEHIKILFDLSTLNDEQKINLKQIAMLGISAHRAQYLEQWLELESKTPLNSLAKIGWLQASNNEENQQFYNLHPIIVDIALREMSLTEDILNRLSFNLFKSLHIDDKCHGTDHKEKFAATQSMIDYLNLQPNSDNSEPLVYLANQLAFCFYHCGFFQQAQILYECTLNIWEKIRGSDHPVVATNLNDIAGIYKILGWYDEALPLYKRSLHIREKVLGFDHIDVANSLNNLAEFYDMQGKYDEALPLYKRALEICEKVLGNAHHAVATIQNNLAELYKAQGKYEDALPLCKCALDIREKVFGHNHPDVATSLNNLALLYKIRGEIHNALPLCERALDIREKALGSNHPDVANSLNNLAGFYQIQRRYGEVMPLYKRALDIREKVLGPDHPDVANTLNNLADLYKEQCKYEDALPLYKRSLDICEKSLGHNHPNVALSLNNLAVLYNEQGEYDDAIHLCKRALKIYKNAFGSNHPHTLLVENNLKFLQEKINHGK